MLLCDIECRDIRLESQSIYTHFHPYKTIKKLARRLGVMPRMYHHLKRLLRHTPASAVVMASGYRSTLTRLLRFMHRAWSKIAGSGLVQVSSLSLQPNRATTKVFAVKLLRAVTFLTQNMTQVINRNSVLSAIFDFIFHLELLKSKGKSAPQQAWMTSNSCLMVIQVVQPLHTCPDQVIFQSQNLLMQHQSCF